jgi:hypothetical protein
MQLTAVAILGALPATVLGSFALGMVFGGFRNLASGDMRGALYAAWGLLGLAGIAGLWLAVIKGPRSVVAAVLIGCGLVAAAIVVSFPPLSLRHAGVGGWLVVALPFAVGAVYLGRVLVSARRKEG